MQKLILASDSPRRRELMSSLGLNYLTCSPHIEEVFDPTLSIEDALQKVAYDKAAAVAQKYPNDIVVGADTIVVLDHQIYGKPQDEEEAKKMLASLSDREHYVLTAVAIIKQQQESIFYESTKVTFYPLEEALIDWYLASKEYKDKAGSYGIQGKGCLFVKGIEGDYYNVVGLPLAQFARKLQAFK